ncbi:MAG: hypothetical protein ABSB40_04950 [Nitrososphaeria archaeon]
MSTEHTQIVHTELIDVLKNILAQEENSIRLVLQKNTGERFLYPPSSVRSASHTKLSQPSTVQTAVRRTSLEGGS